MQFSDFKTLVANFAQRDPSLFNSPAGGGEVDKLAEAINWAKNYAQRLRNFERAKVKAEVTVNKTSGGALSTAVYAGTANTVLVKGIIRARVTSTDGNSLVPIDMATAEQIEALSRRTLEFYPLEDRTTEDVLPFPYINFALYRLGDTVYLYPWNEQQFGATSTVVNMDIYEWLPDLSADEDTNFFLTECRDWTLFKSLSYLNMFLKDDLRVNIPSQILKDAWEAVVAWDTALIEGLVPVNLD